MKAARRKDRRDRIVRAVSAIFESSEDDNSAILDTNNQNPSGSDKTAKKRKFPKKRRDNDESRTASIEWPTGLRRNAEINEVDLNGNVVFNTQTPVTHGTPVKKKVRDIKRINRRRDYDVNRAVSIEWPAGLGRTAAVNEVALHEYAVSNTNTRAGSKEMNGRPISILPGEKAGSSDDFPDIDAVLPKKLYEREIARQEHFSSPGDTLRRRVIPCCSQFYYNMVILGKVPPFEGLQ